jgi:hypothetical protein
LTEFVRRSLAPDDLNMLRRSASMTLSGKIFGTVASNAKKPGPRNWPGFSVGWLPG